MDTSDPGQAPSPPKPPEAVSPDENSERQPSPPIHELPRNKVGFLRPETYFLLKSCLEAMDSNEQIDFQKVATNCRKIFCDNTNTRHPKFFQPERCETQFKSVLMTFKEQHPDSVEDGAPLQRTVQQIMNFLKKSSADDQREFYKDPKNVEYLEKYRKKVYIEDAEARMAMGVAVSKYLSFIRNFDEPPPPNPLLPPFLKVAWDQQNAKNKMALENAKRLAKMEAEKRKPPTKYVRPVFPKVSYFATGELFVEKKGGEPTTPAALVSMDVSTDDACSVDQESVTRSPLPAPSPQPAPPPPPPPPAPPEPEDTKDVRMVTPPPPERVVEEMPMEEPEKKVIPAPVVAKTRVKKSTSAPKIVEPTVTGLKNVTPKKPTMPMAASVPDLQRVIKAEDVAPIKLTPSPIPPKKKTPTPKKTPEKVLSEAEAMPPPPLPQPTTPKEKPIVVTKEKAPIDDAASMPPPDFVPTTSTRANPRSNRRSTATPKRAAQKRQANDDPELTNKIAKIVADAAAQQHAIETSPPEANPTPTSTGRASKAAKLAETTPTTTSILPVRMRRKPATIYSPPSSPNRSTVADTNPSEDGATNTASRKIATASRRKAVKTERASEASSRASSTTVKKKSAPVQQMAYRRFATQSILSFPNRLGIQRRRSKRKSVIFRGVKEVKAVSRTCGTQTVKRIRTRKLRLIKNGAKFPKALEDLLRKSKKNTSKTPDTIPVEIYLEDNKVPNIWSTIEKLPFGQVTRKVCNATDPTGVYHNPVSHFPHYYQVCKAPLFTDAINKKMAANQMTTCVDIQLHMALLAANCKVAARTPEEKTKASDLGIKMLRSLDRQIFGKPPSSKNSGTIDSKSNQ
uniref:Bromo domain-containing protein n=1 Tax=Panagrellus redivivus TaxID=6233 RepID=A0A7E4ZVR3_PANRE